MKKKLTTGEFIEKAKRVHGDRYDYSRVEYKEAIGKVCIICPEHGEFWQAAREHYGGAGCQKCIGKAKHTVESFVQKAKEIHGDKYDYSKIEYKNSKEKVCIICPKHGEFCQTPNAHLRGSGCPKCAKNVSLTTQTFIKKAKEIHGGKYDYSKAEYKRSSDMALIICPEHGEFWQRPYCHLQGDGCPKCAGRKDFLSFEEAREFVRKLGLKSQKEWFQFAKSNKKPENIPLDVYEKYKNKWLSWPDFLGTNEGYKGHWSPKKKLAILNQLRNSDLRWMDPLELYVIIGQGNLPSEFESLLDSDANSEERTVALKKLKETIQKDVDEELDESADSVDAVDEDMNMEEKKKTPKFNILNGIKLMDSDIYAINDEEALNALVEHNIRKLWNSVLNGDTSVEQVEKEDGGEYFSTIKNRFISEYQEVLPYTPPKGYSFRHPLNMMQKLTVNRLLKNRNYGNWSGTGSGKTMSFTVSSREIDARLTLVIAVNSTVGQLCESIKEVYPDSKVFSSYQKGQKFNRYNHNYLVLNYEKFQQDYSEQLFQNLTNENIIDFVVLDEVHSAKQRDESDESIRRGILTRLIGRARENNPDMYTLVMSATPVINNLFEAKSLLSLMTGKDYDDLGVTRTKRNAVATYVQLTINGLRFIPKYDISLKELTAYNTPKLNIDGSHLLDKLIGIPEGRFFDIEKILLQDKLNSIKPYLRKGVMVYSYYVDGVVPAVRKYIEKLGFKVGIFTGDEGTQVRSKTLCDFIGGKIDILIASKPITTGVDGLQQVCNRAIVITLPWTDSEYQQFKGRIYRQGSVFKKVEIVIPQVKIKIDDDVIWSWDVQRLNLIRNKRTLADACVDGYFPSKVIPSPQTMFKKTQESLQRWKDRITNGVMVEYKRDESTIDLYPEISEEERVRVRNSELQEFNRRGKVTLSSTMHKEFTYNKDSWFHYHYIRRKSMNDWGEIPYEYIASKIKNKRHVVVDFGCGENKMKDLIPNNKVISFDHVSIDETVIACDMSDINQYVEDESVDVAVFSLSLWGVNFKDYLKEAYRVLSYGGFIHIAEPALSYENEDDFKNLIAEFGFKLVGDVEYRDKFVYISGTKG